MAVNSNEMDAFEQRLKESLEHYEVPYNSADWAQMERALASGVRSWGTGRAWIAGLLLTGGLLIGGTAYFLGRDTAKTVQTESTDPAMGTGQTQAAAPSTVAGAVDKDEATGQATAATTKPKAGATTISPSPAPAGKPVRGTAVPMVAGATAESTKGESPKAASVGVFKASTKQACPGSPVEFTVEHMPEDGIYLWNFGDGSFSNKPNPQHVFSKPGNYQVMLSMSTTGVGSIRNKATSDMIVIHEAPHAAFNILKVDRQGQVPSVHFESRAHGANSYLWDFGDGSVSTLSSPDHVYRKKGVYQVVQTVTNEVGCVDQKIQEVRIERDFDLGAPKSFSPNSDGVEDSFMPQGLTELRTKFQLAVYDKGGNLVYNTSDASRPWYGKAKNQGPLLDAGEYVWVADVDTERGTETFTGTVKLER